MSPLEVVNDRVQALKSSLEPGHVLHTMILEHERILGFLKDLHAANLSIQRFDHFDSTAEEFSRLRHIAEHLLGAESHHQREEEVLFPELERRGLMGPTQVMRAEHQELRVQKKHLKDLAEGVSAGNFSLFKRQLAPEALGLVSYLGDHIDKENNILYPMAVQVIQGKEVWDQLRAECDRIGYCCFTPNLAKKS